MKIWLSANVQAFIYPIIITLKKKVNKEGRKLDIIKFKIRHKSLSVTSEIYEFNMYCFEHDQ